MSWQARFTFREIVAATGAWPLRPLFERQEGEAVGVSIDSRRIRPGELFIAIRGKRLDGHDFLTQAFRDGAAGAIVEDPQKVPRGLKPIWYLPDTLKALGDLAKFHRTRFQLPAVAITGSSGKTTTKAMVAHLLSERFNTLANPGTQNNQIGVPLTLLRLEQEHQALVVELGTNQWGEIQRLTEIAQPEVGVVTNIGPAHLETFGDLRGVFKAKGELWETMDSQGIMILNANDPILRVAARDLRQRTLWFAAEGFSGFDGQEDGPPIALKATDIRLGAATLRCRINQRYLLELPLPGMHNLMNALAALTCAMVLGEDLSVAVERLREMPPLAGRLHFHEQEGVLILDDSYNANPDSLKAALEVFSRIRRPGRKAVLLGDMLELGAQAESLHVEAGRWVVSTQPQLLVAVGPLARWTLAGAWEEDLGRLAGHSFDTSEDAGRFLMQWLKPGDALFVKGSRGMQMERAVECFSTSSTP